MTLTLQKSRQFYRITDSPFASSCVSVDASMLRSPIHVNWHEIAAALFVFPGG